MIESLQQFVVDLPTWLQWAGTLAVAGIPFVESYFGSVLGVIAGLHPAIAITAAVVGNTVTMAGFVLAAAQTRRLARGDAPTSSSPKRQKLRRAFDKYGVAGVSLFGQTMLPSQITSAAMVGFGASPRRVITWQLISIILWGLAFGVLATMGVELIDNP